MKTINKVQLVCFFVISVFLLGFSEAPSESTSENILISSLSIVDTKIDREPCYKQSGDLEIKKDCTVTIKNDDMDIEITLHDVGTWNCLKLKAKAAWASLTGKL